MRASRSGILRAQRRILRCLTQCCWPGSQPPSPLHYLHLHPGRLADTIIQSNLQSERLSDERETTTYRCRCRKDVHRTKLMFIEPSDQTITRESRSKLARIRCYTMLYSVLFLSASSTLTLFKSISNFKWDLIKRMDEEEEGEREFGL